MPEAVKIVIHYLNGTVLKGYTFDFSPDRPFFHLEANDIGMTEVALKDLKAVFFVKDFAGDPVYVERRILLDGENPIGRKVKIQFLDGEILIGTTLNYNLKRLGFFLAPLDAKSNNLRVFVVINAVKTINGVTATA